MELTRLVITWTTVPVLLLLSVAVILAFVLRRLFFHPLSKYPGPWYRSISEVPLVCNLIGGKQYACYKRLHEKYGPVVRVAPNELSFLTGTAMEDIYGLRNPTQKDRKWIGAILPRPPYPMTSAPRDIHARQRRAFASVFTNSALLNEEKIIQGQVDELITAFYRKVDENGGAAVVDMLGWGKFYSFDVIGLLAFGAPFGCLKSEANIKWSRNIGLSIMMGAYEQASVRLVGFDSPLQPPLVKLLAPAKYYNARTYHSEKSLKAIQNSLADTDRDHKDFVYHILKANDHRRLLSDGEIQKNLVTFIIAGSETVGWNLAIWSYWMGTHRNVYYKLRDLIREKFARSEDINWTALKDIKYLSAVIRESMRLLGTSIQRIRVVPEGGKSIDGHWIPGGTTVAVAEYAAAHSEMNFKDPWSFRPERWMDPDCKDNLSMSKPFAYGPRDCIGKNLAGIELRLAIAHILWHFDLDVDLEDEGNKKWSPENDFEHLYSFIGFEFPPLWTKLTKANRPGLL